MPIYPASPFGALSHVGPMTRTVADAALLLDVVSGADPRDAWALAPAAPTAAALDAPVAGLRVAVSATLGYVDVDPGVAAAFEAAVDVLATLGVRVEEVDPGFADPIAAFETLWFAGAAASLRQRARARAGRHGPRAGGRGGRGRADRRRRAT